MLAIARQHRAIFVIAIIALVLASSLLVDAPWWHSDTEVTHDGGRLTAYVSRERSQTVITVADGENRDTFEVARFYGREAPVQMRWDGDVLKVRWFQPDGEGPISWLREVVHMLARDASHTATFEPCLESGRPLLCRMDVGSLYDRCTEDAHCTSQRCEYGYCARAPLGGACANDHGCESGSACVARTCRAVDDGVCDSDADCGTSNHCIQNPQMVVGKCYDGVKGDPCLNKDDCEYGFLCEGVTARGAGVCVTDPNAVFF